MASMQQQQFYAASMNMDMNMNDYTMPAMSDEFTGSTVSMTDGGGSGYLRQVTPPTADPGLPPPPPVVDFDSNMDYPQDPNPLPPAPRRYYDPQPCDVLKQRVLDSASGEYYKADCILLEDSADRAYWLYQPIRKAMFGTVWRGHVLQRPANFGLDANISHWETTGQSVAIKQASKQLMVQASNLNSAEHPQREHAALQQLYYQKTGGAVPADQAMCALGVMTPQDWLQDEHFAYLIMPYCNGGELFDRVGAQGRFTEDEARHWMHQILNSLETLHSAGVTHRDLSLENIMIHNDKAVIIDLGMSLPIPYDPQTGQRRLLAPQGAAGKLKYMAPEVFANAPGGYDGFAVDMWAVGVIMYIMLTGEVPWQMPCPTDLKFQKLSDGWVEPYLKGQGYPLSANAFCLLQRMLWQNPKDRLCMAQVRAHPWMRMGGQGATGGSPMQALYSFKSANFDDDDNVEANDDENVITVMAPKEIQKGKYSHEETLSGDTLSLLLEMTQKYSREESDSNSSTEEVLPTPKTPTVLSEEDDEYVKALKSKKDVAVTRTTEEVTPQAE